MWQRTIDCLGTSVRIRTNLPELEGVLAGVLRSYAEHAGEPEINYFLDAGPPPVVWLEHDRMQEVERPIDLLPAFERNLSQRVLMYTTDVVLHAGAVVDDSGRALVVAGASGSGKSTLTRGLLAHGLRYLSEECVAIMPGQRCRGLARALHVDDPSIAVPDGYRVDDYPLRPHPPGTFRLFHPPEHAIWRGEARTAAIVALSHGPDAPDTLEAVTSGEAVQALWPAIFHRTPDALPRLGPAFEGVPLYRLRTRTPARALELVRGLLA